MAASQWTAKADAFADVLTKELTMRLSQAGGLTAALTVVKTYDANDNAPILTIGGAAAGSPGGSIKIRGVLSFGKDSLGNQQINYGMPHEVILVTENVAPITNPDTAWTTLHMMGCLLRFGALVRWQVTAAATAPTVANGAAAGDKATFDNLQYPGVGSV